MYVYYGALIVSVIILSELAAYFWHRIASHSDLVLSNIHDTHRIHHTSDLKHQANEDFLWIIIGLIGLYIVFLIGFSLGIFNLPTAIIIPTVITSIFACTWYVHSAYHIEDHWLNKYDWFKNNKARHFIHHDLPDKNYGIITQIPDMLFGTFEQFKDTTSLDTLINEMDI